MHKQFLNGDCAHYALLHCLEAFGINMSMAELRGFTGVSWLEAAIYGIDQYQLVGAITYMGYDTIQRDSLTYAAFKPAIDRLLKQRYKLILSVQNGAHWAAVIEYSQTTAGNMMYHCIDSRPLDGKSYDLWRRWDEMKAWMETTDDLCAIALRPR